MKETFAVIRCLLLVILSSLVFSPSGMAQDAGKLAEREQQLAAAVKASKHAEAAEQAYAIAALYEDAGKLDKAATYLGQSLSYSKKASSVEGQYRASYQLGRIYSTLKSYSKALDNFQGAVKAARSLQNKAFETESLIQSAMMHAAQDRPKRSIEPLTEALALALEKNDIDAQAKCYSLLATYYKALGDEKKATEYLAHYNAIILGQKNAKEIRELTREGKKSQQLNARKMEELKAQIDQVESEKKLTESELLEQRMKLQQTEDSLRIVEEISLKRQLEIDLLNKDKELASAKIREQNAVIEKEALFRSSVIVGILLVGALALVLIVGYRRKIRVNKRLHQQNENIKSSINYAKRIQEAMLPRKDQQSKIGDSFVLFKPRDVVSGDFYWFSDVPNGHDDPAHNDIAFAAVDCTGHGVPGAFMSMIGINALNGIVNRGVTETNAILDALHKEIRTALRQEVTGNNDGMDAALCIYRRDKKILEFSGAKSPLIYIQNNTLNQVKGDIHPIGGSKTKPTLSFKKHEIPVNVPTTVYLFSDGYRDQFGGKENMKFMSKRFSKLLLDIHALPMTEQLTILDKTIEEWKDGRGQTDDILVMAIRLGGV